MSIRLIQCTLFKLFSRENTGHGGTILAHKEETVRSTTYLVEVSILVEVSVIAKILLLFEEPVRLLWPVPLRLVQVGWR